MEDITKSEGKCVFCSQMFKKSGISRHLATELEKQAETAEKGISFYVKIEPPARYYGSNGFFLYLWVDGNAQMKDIDAFLRDIWLECCGHMSAFRNPKNKNRGGWDFMDAMNLMQAGKIKEYEKLMEESDGEIPMSRKVKDVLTKDLVLEYEYDFGSSTYLTLKALEVYPVKASKKIVLLSRNEPLHIYCGSCKKEPAVTICSVDGGCFCNKCAKKHAKECEDFADYAAMPVVNSPRMGVCGYEGGTIDTERDGVYRV